MGPKLNADGTVSVPMRAEGENGLVGDGVVILKPGDQGYEEAVKEAEPRDS